MISALAPPVFNLVHLPVVTSTMDVLDEMIADGAPEWTVVLADEQTHGLGRAGRTWDAAPRSALLCSILVRPRFPPEQSGMLAITVGVAIAECVESFGVRVRLKWPNDVLLDGRKLAGILIRTRRDGIGPIANIGIGLNLTVDGRGDDGRASLGEATRDVPEAADIVGRLVGRLAYSLATTDMSFIRDAWLARAAFVGQHVTVEDRPKLVTGVLSGIDDKGALLVEGRDGARHVIVAGDVVRGPRLGSA